MNNGLGSLKERHLLEVEKVINDIRKRREFLEKEWQELTDQETEARDLMQLLRTGNVRSRNKATTHEEYLTAIETISEEKEVFSIDDVFDLAGQTRAGVAQKLVKLAKDGIVERVGEGRSGMYKLVKKDA